MMNPTAGLSNDALRQQATEILAQEDFQRYLNQSSDQFDFWRWLSKLLNFKFPFETHGDGIGLGMVATALKFFAVILLLAIVIYTLYWLYQRFLKTTGRKAQAEMPLPGSRQQARASYTQQASEALAAQNFRLAIHCLFLAAVTRVIADSNLQDMTTMTNREIAAACNFETGHHSQALKQSFEQMLYLDEPRWFGPLPATESDYRTAEQYYQQFEQAVG